ncbi:MAG: FkbM family methyltransferase [Phycisphaerales bacterium]|nr:FkbM family methyltransferase [Phycisphaerales bacterium]
MATVRFHWHRHAVTLSLDERFERWAFFLARYHEYPLQLLMKSVLRSGETFIDVGANIGLVSLLASWLVGDSGTVIAYEPNPEVRQRLSDHVTRNRVRNIRTREFALGDRPSRLTLTTIGKNTGSATLGDVPVELQPHVTSRFSVDVVPGDSEAGLWYGEPPTRAVPLLKIDAEGAETSIVRGLAKALATHKPIVVLEVNPFALRMNGSNPRELRSTLTQLGYHGWVLSAPLRILRRRIPLLSPLKPLPVSELHDEVWCHADSGYRDRVAQFIVGG